MHSLSLNLDKCDLQNIKPLIELKISRKTRDGEIRELIESELVESILSNPNSLNYELVE